jgi:mono/diheme cytochrome c family protein
VAGWFLSAPRPLTAEALPQHTADPANGQVLYNIGGCISCHKPGKDQAGADPALPSGGFALKTPVGTFYPRNLTPDKDTGIRGWSDLQFVNAVQRGISPAGTHYIPALPYTSYAAMKVGDILDIRAWLASLKPVSAAYRQPDLPLAFFVRRGLGLWKYVGLDTTPWTPDPAQTASWNRGSYLVNGPGHCQECHTPRTFYMARNDSIPFAGGLHPEGNGKVPSLRDLVGRKRYKDAGDIASALQYGELFGYDKVSSGGMGSVQTNISKLPEADIKAIAEFLVSLK